MSFSNESDSKTLLDSKNGAFIAITNQTKNKGVNSDGNL